MTIANAAIAQELVDNIETKLETEQTAILEDVADKLNANIAAAAYGKAQARAAIEAQCRAIREIREDAGEALNVAEGMADQPIIFALRALKGDVLSDSDVNAILCDSFGSKDDKGKTPEGYGLSLRKRIRTLDTARRIVKGDKLDKLPTWADWNDVQSLADWLDAIESGETSPSYAYSQITAKPKGDKVILALKADQIALLAEQLVNPDTLAAIKASDALKVAYAALTEKLAALA